MSLQYLSDSSGKKTAVVIPIGEWENITKKHNDLKNLDAPIEQKMKPSDFAGALSEEGYIALNEYIQQARNEWDRDTY